MSPQIKTGNNTMEAAALLAALQACANKPAFLPPPTKASFFPSRLVSAPSTGHTSTFGVALNQTHGWPHVTPVPMTYGNPSPRTTSDVSAQLCQLALALDMLRAAQAPAARVPVFTQPALPPRQPLSLAPAPVATTPSISIQGPWLLQGQGLNNSKQCHADAPLQALRPSPKPDDCMSGCSRSQQPELDSGVSQTFAELEGADVGGTFLSRDRILQVYSLRSRHTCSARTPIERTAAGRSAVVAHIYNMPVEYVRDIWSRACASHITEPVYAEYVQQRYNNKVMISNMRRSLKRKHQNDQQSEPRKRKVAAAEDAQVEDWAGTPPAERQYC